MWHSYADFGLNSCSVVRWLSHMASILPACTAQAAWSTGNNSPPVCHTPATAAMAMYTYVGPVGPGAGASSWPCGSWVWCTPLAMSLGVSTGP
jgi:hypothetical protein